MNILFLTLLDFESVSEHGIYTDLIREFSKRDHSVYVISPVEKRKKQTTRIIDEHNVKILKLQIGNIQKTNILEKGISTLSIEPQIIRGIKDYFSNIAFDLILYSTPPITFIGAVDYIKHRDHAKTYLLLKDIFPQNAVDLGMMSKAGPKSILYRYFRNKEKRLYAVSDRIGCMSQANVDYVLAHNPEIDPSTVEICPNSIEVVDKSVDYETRKSIREKYGIPQDKKVFVYGGNLGKPQGIDFMLRCMDRVKDITEAYFLIVGDGTEYPKIESYVNAAHQKNLKLMKRIPKEDYDAMVGACDVGLIFLDHRFTIPNFPSRLLSYMQAKLPVLACTDPNTDIGKVIVEGGFGWWCESDDADAFSSLVCSVVNEQLPQFGQNGFHYLQENYSSKSSYRQIMSQL